MMGTGSILVLISLVLLVIWYLTEPFFSTLVKKKEYVPQDQIQQEVDRIQDLIQIMDLDHDLGKIADKEYHEQRIELEKKVTTLVKDINDNKKKIETVEVSKQNYENGKVIRPSIDGDPIEVLIARRKRARLEKTTGFCPKCGTPFSESDKYCPKCGFEIIDEAR